jgi:hypothetical protein
MCTVLWGAKRVYCLRGQLQILVHYTAEQRQSTGSMCQGVLQFPETNISLFNVTITIGLLVNSYNITVITIIPHVS